MPGVFISYARKDSEFVHRLYDALKAHGMSVWVDWESILPSAEWLKEIFQAIEAADAVIFVISPDSVASEVCGKELAHALAHHKRLMPVLYREVPVDRINQTVAAHNWVLCRETDDLAVALDALIVAIETDLSWVHAHTRLLTRAVEWEKYGHDHSLALSGNDLRRAEQMLTQAGLNKEPPLTPLQIDYILASRRNVNRRHYIAFGALTFGLIVTIILSMLWWENRKEADLYLSRDFLSKSIWALADNDVLAARVMLAESLTLDDRLETRERYLEAEIRGARLEWVTPGQAGTNDCALSRNGAWCALKNDDATLRVWDMRRQREVERFAAGKGGDTTSMALSPGGDLLATGGRSGIITVWQPRTGRRLQTLGGRHGLYCLAFSPDGARIAAASKDLTISLWDLRSGRRVQVLRGFDERISALAFSPDGATLAVGDWDYSVWLWDLKTGRCLHRLRAHEDIILSLAFSPNGRTLATGSWDTSIWLWDVASGRGLRPLLGSQAGILCLLFTRDGRRLVSGGEEGAVRVWDISTGRNLLTLTGHRGGIGSLAFDPDEHTLITANQDGIMHIWDMDTVDRKPELLCLRGHTGVASAVVFSPDGRWLASGSEDKTIRIWDARTGALARLLRGHRKGVWSLSFDPSGHTLVSGSRDGTARIWEAATGRLLHILRLHGPVRKVQYSPDGKLLATGSDAAAVRLWDPASGRLAAVLPQTDAVDTLTFSPDGALLAVGTEDGNIRVWDVRASRRIRDLHGHAGSVWDLAFTRDSRLLISGGDDTTVRVWDLTTGREARRILGPKLPVWDIALHPDGVTVASAGEDAVLRLYNRRTGETLALRGYQGGIWAIAFSPDGRFLASAGQDRLIRIWNLPATRTVLRTRPALLLDRSERDTGLVPSHDGVVPMPAARFVAGNRAAP